MTLPESLKINAVERFDSLYQYFAQRYELEQFNLQWESYQFIITTIKNIDQLLDELIGQGPDSVGVKDERLPYWAELWPSSIALAEYLLLNLDMASGMNAIELGCGVGLAGIAAARRGATVLVTDYQPDALRLTELNWLMNLGIAPTALLLDWRTASLSQKFDLIIASDVVYEKRFFNPLIELFKNLLSPAGQILLSEPNRNIAREFFSSLTETGFIFQSVDSKVTFKDKIYQVTIYSINRRESGPSPTGGND